MDTIPLDYRLFEPSAKSQRHTPILQQSQHQQQKLHLSSTKAIESVSSQHRREKSFESNLSSTGSILNNSISRSSRSSSSQSNSRISTVNEYTEFNHCQFATENINAMHIVQSGSYVEILKQTNGSSASVIQSSPSTVIAQSTHSLHSPVQILNSRICKSDEDEIETDNNEMDKSDYSSGSILLMSTALPTPPLSCSILPTACQNKVYGDFLTIDAMPRRKNRGRRRMEIDYMSSSSVQNCKQTSDDDIVDDIGVVNNIVKIRGDLSLCNEIYQHSHYHPSNAKQQHQSKQLTLLDLEDGDIFHYQRDIEAMSNADTLAIGASMNSGHLDPPSRPYRVLAAGTKDYEISVTENGDNSLSPPSAFCDKITNLSRV